MYRACKIRFERRTPKNLNKQKKAKTKQTKSRVEGKGKHTPIFKSLSQWGGGDCLGSFKVIPYVFPNIFINSAKKGGGSLFNIHLSVF